jgi:hypothetical protein
MLPHQELALIKLPAPAPRKADTAESVLLAITAARTTTRKDVPLTDVDPATITALKTRLDEENVSYDTSDINAAEIRFRDLIGIDHVVYAIDVANSDAEVFIATYVISRGTIVATFEAVSS